MRQDLSNVATLGYQLIRIDFAWISYFDNAINRVLEPGTPNKSIDGTDLAEECEVLVCCGDRVRSRSSLLYAIAA